MVADFGIALALSAAAGGRMTETGLSLGTPHYMSPEQATAEKEITARSDIYSLAACSTRCSLEIHRTRALSTTDHDEIIAEQPQPVTELRKSVPPNVAAALAKALEKLPADRFESAKAFAEALTNPAFTTMNAAATAAATTTVRGWLRNPLSWAAMAVAVALALVVISRRPPSQAPPMLRQDFLTFPDSLQPIAPTFDGGTGHVRLVARCGSSRLRHRHRRPDTTGGEARQCTRSDGAPRQRECPVAKALARWPEGALRADDVRHGVPRSTPSRWWGPEATGGGFGLDRGGVGWRRLRLLRPEGPHSQGPEAGGDPDTLVTPESGEWLNHPSPFLDAT